MTCISQLARTHWRIILHSKGILVKAPWNSVQNLITFLLGFWFGSVWEVVCYLVVLGANFGVHNRDVTSVRASQASQYLTKLTPQIMWSTEVENNEIKLSERVTGEPKDRSWASLVFSAVPLPLENTTFSCDLYEIHEKLRILFAWAI